MEKTPHSSNFVKFCKFAAMAQKRTTKDTRRAPRLQKTQPHEYRPQPYDLFGEVIVTTLDVRAWLLTVVPRIDPDGPRAARYVQLWNVAGKIASHKVAGSFEKTTTPRPPMADDFAIRMNWL